MKVESVPIATLSQDPANARKHDDKNLEAIKASLRRFGQQKPIVVDSSNVVRAGNGTLAAATALGWESINVVQTDLQGSEATAYAIADNRTAELAEWDESVLAASLSSLADVDETWLSDLQFSEKELAKLVASTQEQEIIEDEVPELPADPVTQPGDVWLLGRHRLLCGDSTDASQVKRIVEGNRANMVFTDPPYNIAFKGTMSDTSKDGKKVPHKPANTKHKDIKNDAKTKNEFQEFVLKMLDIIRTYCEGAYYISFCSGNLHELLHPLANSIGYKSIIIWTKNQSPMGGGAYRRRYEPIIYGNFSSEFYGKAYSEDDVWQFDRTRKNDIHPTMKPVELITHAIRHGSKKGHSVLDLFLGSGTTLIAAEQIDRTCYGLEISPEYCDVIVERWQNLTGKKARLEGGGATA